MYVIKLDEEDLEAFAELCHSQWSGWINYLFDKGEFNADGTFTMPAWAVERWKRQAETKYLDLSAKEQDNDRAEAKRVFNLIEDVGLPT